jgi:2-(1,2-epoxy-1,2-dihydrophenyl)acetyl-CoA isomerase
MFVLKEQLGGVLRLTLNRPEKYNSVNRELTKELITALDEGKEDSSVRVIYLTGAGKGFCAGQDLGEATEPSADIETIVNETYNPLILRLRQIEKPIICAVNGVAAGAGANIALACDIVIATKSANFIQAFSKIGLIPDSAGTYILPRLVGFGKALGMAMLGDKISAEEASQMGMIYKAVEDDKLEEEAMAIANKLAKMPTKALGLTKRAFNVSETNSLEGQLKVEAKIQAESSKTYDFQEGINAFLEKRKPVFKGE